MFRLIRFLFTLITATLISTMWLDAQTPNRGFELWENSGITSQPVGWQSLNAIVGAGSGQIASPVTPAEKGCLAMSVTTSLIEVAPSVFDSAGLVTSGTFSPLGQAIGGEPISSSPERFKYRYKYFPVGSDQGEVFLLFSRWNAGMSKRDTLGVFRQQLAAASNWTFQEILTPGISGTPDSVLIVISSSNLQNPSALRVGSELHIDELFLEWSFGTAPQGRAGFDRCICAGTSAQIGDAGGTATGGTGPYSYAWSPATGLDDPTAANPNATITSTTVYTVTVTDNNSFTGTDSILLVATPAPTADAGTDTAFCVGGIAALGGSGTSSGMTYSWSPLGDIFDASSANTTATPATTTNYVLSVTDPQTGCSSTDTMTVTVDEGATLDVGNDTSICSGDTVILGGSPTASGTGPFSYSWTPNTQISDTAATNPAVYPSATTTYRLEVIDGNGCLSFDTVVVTSSFLSVNAGGPSILACLGDTVTIGGTPTVFGGVDPITYNWTPGDELLDSTVANPQIIVSENIHSFSVEVIDAAGCIGNSLNVNIFASSLPTITCPDDVKSCGDSTVTYTAPVVTDRCPGTTLTQTGGIASGGVFPLGTTTNTFVATSATQISTSCSFTVTYDVTSAAPTNGKISDLQGGFAGELLKSDKWGQAVSFISDMNGDGIADLIVGAGNASPLRPDAKGNLKKVQRAGATWTLFMNSDGSVASYQKVAVDTGDFPPDTVQKGDKFGSSVAEIGDLDFDGVSEYAVGSPGYTVIDQFGKKLKEAGAVYIVFPNADGTVKNVVRITRDQGGLTSTDAPLNKKHQFGASVAGIGDFNLDGAPDLIVGAPGDDDADGPAKLQKAGALYLLTLNFDGTVSTATRINATNGGLTANSLDKKFEFGASVTSLGDIDGDFVADLCVGSPGSNALDPDRGKVIKGTGGVWLLYMNNDGSVKNEKYISYGFSGMMTQVLGKKDQFGKSVANASDFDGDGFTDVAVGAPLDDELVKDGGAVHILNLGSNGDVVSVEKIHSAGSGFSGTIDSKDGFGSSVASNAPSSCSILYAIGASFDDDASDGKSKDLGAVWMVQVPDVLAPKMDPASVNADNLSADAGLEEQLVTEFELDNNFTVKVYPNPNNGMFKFEIDGLSNQDYEMTVTSFIGNVIYKESSSQSTETIDLSDVAEGIYFLNLRVGSVSKTVKVMVTK